MHQIKTMYMKHWNTLAHHLDKGLFSIYFWSSFSKDVHLNLLIPVLQNGSCQKQNIVHFGFLIASFCLAHISCSNSLTSVQALILLLMFVKSRTNKA